MPTALACRIGTIAARKSGRGSLGRRTSVDAEGAADARGCREPGSPAGSGGYFGLEAKHDESDRKGDTIYLMSDQPSYLPFAITHGASFSR
jgi:hypothetical protein